MPTGRDVETQLLVTNLAAGRATVVTGPAGIGKSTLCRNVLGSVGSFAEAGGFASLRWAPMQPFRRLLGSRVRDDADGVASQVLRLGVGGLLIDDVQWVDLLSLRTVDRLVGRMPLLVTLRTGDPGSTEALGLMIGSGCETLDLGPLSSSAAEVVLDEARPGLGGPLRRAILDQARGNPLLLTQLAVDGGASVTLMRALQGRLDDQPAEVRRAMIRLSVLGRPATSKLLGPGAAGLLHAGLAVPVDEGSMAVRHELLAEMVVESLGDRANAVRRQLAEVVAGAEAAFLLARAGDRGEARRLALSAAEGDVPPRTAAELLVLATSCGPDDLESGLDVRMAAARALTSVGDPKRALDLCLDLGVDGLECRRRGALLAVAAEAAWNAGLPERFTDLIGRAVDDLRGSRTAIEVQALAGSTLVQTRIGLDGQPALQRAYEAVALADELGEKQGFARYRLASVLLTAGEPGWADLYREVVAAAVKDGDHPLAQMAAESFVLGAWTAGRIDDAATAAETLERQGPRWGYEAPWLGAVAYGALISVLAGQDRTGVLDRWVPRLRDEARFRNRGFARAAAVLAAADLGRLDDAAALLDDQHEEQESDLQVAALLGWVRAEAAWAAGRSTEVGVIVATVTDLGLGDHPAVINARVIGAYAGLDLGAAPIGTEPMPPLPAWAGATPEWRGLVAFAAGEFESAVDLLDQAAEAWAKHDRRSEARARWAAGEAARRAGQIDAAGRLRTAEELAEETGVRTLVVRARRSQRAAGARRSPVRAAGVAGLTGRETEMLRLVGAGLTSPQIAAQLQLSRSTVDAFVGAANRKLGVSNRLAAAALLVALERDAGSDRR